ncbi:UpxY family transcription antiterminator [Gaoshiqia sediminis]|uniref:UpxY family transcription antiterminator n=1 Tax=Gaoshiqia sediminis TaxID=2986998 RepID=A0AA41Y495_9BACT|nr:UpxY family transcription antiterminator [Gaoshiqia sediminis]MCW0483164.1 UpxY family transcription antiterminator [Gaoshiqia sediminis]
MSLVNSTYQWLAVYTRSRSEKKLLSELVKKGIDCYLPLKIEKRQWSDRIKKIEEPLLKGYLFVKVSNKEYFNVLNTPGAVTYVSFEGKAAPIPEKQINDLKTFMKFYNDQVDVTRESLSKGEKVIVVTGPLKGVTGEITDFRGKNRIALRFENLGYCVLTDIALQDVEIYKPDLIPSHRKLADMLTDY